MEGLEKDFLTYLGRFITDHKKKLMEEILSKRTRYFTVVLKKAGELEIPDFFLTEREKDTIRSKWYRGLVKQVELHEKEFFGKHGH
jgi:hypothetical protein